MTLDEWIAQEGAGEIARLVRATGLSAPTIDRARERRATLESAEKIALATRGKVELGHMTKARPVPTLRPPALRARARRASA